MRAVGATSKDGHMTITTDDGRADFDFLYGDWHVLARRTKDALDPACDDWHEFEMSQVARPLLGGLGNTDSCETETGPDGEPFLGLTLRLFDPRDGQWRIWWSSNRNPGHLDPPLTGKFEGRRGSFYAKDQIGGVDVDVRFIWVSTDADSPTWEQAFSQDGGESWYTNFTMAFTRLPAVA
jgi:hypothetical protein